MTLSRNFDKKDIISRCQNRNTISFWLTDIKRNNIIGLTKIEKRALQNNKVTSYSKLEKRIKGVNRNIFDICFLYWRIIIYN